MYKFSLIIWRYIMIYGVYILIKLLINRQNCENLEKYSRKNRRIVFITITKDNKNTKIQI